MFSAALLAEGKLQIHKIERQSKESQPDSIFPSCSGSDVITCFDLSDEFLVYGTETGKISILSTEDWAVVHNFDHNVIIYSKSNSIRHLKFMQRIVLHKIYMYSRNRNKSDVFGLHE